MQYSEISGARRCCAVGRVPGIAAPDAEPCSTLARMSRGMGGWGDRGVGQGAGPAATQASWMAAGAQPGPSAPQGRAWPPSARATCAPDSLSPPLGLRPEQQRAGDLSPQPRRRPSGGEGGLGPPREPGRAVGRQVYEEVGIKGK